MTAWCIRICHDVLQSYRWGGGDSLQMTLSELQMLPSKPAAVLVSVVYHLTGKRSSSFVRSDGRAALAHRQRRPLRAPAVFADLTFHDDTHTVAGIQQAPRAGSTLIREIAISHGFFGAFFSFLRRNRNRYRSEPTEQRRTPYQRAAAGRTNFRLGWFLARWAVREVAHMGKSRLPGGNGCWFYQRTVTNPTTGSRNGQAAGTCWAKRLLFDRSQQVRCVPPPTPSLTRAHRAISPDRSPRPGPYRPGHHPCHQPAAQRS
jgi:hypothetical protein